MKYRLSVVVVALLLAWLPLRAEGVSSDDGEQGGPSDKRGAFVEYVTVQDGSLPSSNTIATKLSVPLQLTPSNVGTVGEALLYEQGAGVLGDALRNVSGLNIQNGSGVHDFYAIRGFDSVSSGLVMTDGTAEPAVSYYPMYNVRGVEVFKGPGGFLYGKNPLAGAVNIVRKQPLPGDFTVLHGSVGGFATRAGTIDWNRSNGEGNVSFRLNGLWQASDHYRDDMRSEHVAANPSLTLNLGARSKLNLNFEYVEADFRPDNGLPLVNGRIPNVPRQRSYQSAGDFSEQSLGRFQIDFETELSGSVTLRNKTYYRGLDWRTDGTLLQGAIPTGGTGDAQVLRDLAVLDDRQQFFGNQFEAIVSLASGSVQHRLLFGVEVVRETDKYTFDIQPLSDVLLSDPSTEVPEGPGFPLSSLGDVTNTVVAPYVVDQIEFSPLVGLVVGARYDHIAVDGDVKSLYAFDPTPAVLSRDDSEVSPMMGLVLAPGPALSLYANASRSFAPPSTRLVEDVDPSTREPERGTQFELGVKRQFMGGKVRSTIAAYQLERDRIAITDPFTGFTQQAADQRSRGVEIEVAAEPRPRLRTFFSYAYNDAELTEFVRLQAGNPIDLSGNVPALAPEHLANLWVSKSFGNGFGLSGGARFIDEQYISEDNAFAIDSALVIDTALFFDTEAWRFKLNLNNITDEEYETRGIAGASSVIPSDPFAAYLSVEFRLR